MSPRKLKPPLRGGFVTPSTALVDELIPMMSYFLPASQQKSIPISIISQAPAKLFSFSSLRTSSPERVRIPRDADHRSELQP